MYLLTKSRGMTLIELMVVVSLVAITAVYAVPSFTNLIANNQVRSTANSFVGFFNYGRSEAVKRGTTILSGPMDGANWDSGARLWIDGDGNGTFDAADTELRRLDGLPGALSLSGSLTTVGFRSNGYVTPAPTSAATQFSLGVCSGSVSDGSTISVGFSGRVSTAVRNCP